MLHDKTVKFYIVVNNDGWIHVLPSLHRRTEAADEAEITQAVTVAALVMCQITRMKVAVHVRQDHRPDESR